MKYTAEEVNFSPYQVGVIESREKARMRVKVVSAYDVNQLIVEMDGQYERDKTQYRVHLIALVELPVIDKIRSTPLGRLILGR